MRKFNKNNALKSIKIIQNKNTYIKRLSISLSCLILVCVIILLTFAKFETGSEEYTLINGKIVDDSCEYDPGKTWTYSYTGSAQSFTTPCNGYYKIELWGAQGNYPSTNRVKGGLGAYTSGSIKLGANKNLFVYVGENRTDRSASFNAGSTGGSSNDTTSLGGAGYGGGGATDVRLVSGAWNNAASLNSRIMVAAGGGGGNNYTGPATGGNAGGLIGYDGACGAYSSSYTCTLSNPTGGTQTSTGTTNGSASSYVGSVGSFGVGGNGSAYASGGGGGYYGGAGAGHGNGIVYSGPGGSSYISGHTGSIAIANGSTSEPRAVKKSGCTTGTTDNECSIHFSGYKFTNTKMIDGSGYEWTNEKATTSTGMPTHDGTSTMTGNSGSGYAKITYLGSCRGGSKSEFDYTGSAQTYNVFCDGRYKVELWGAQGGEYDSTYYGGRGGYTFGEIELSSLSKLYVYVGEKGKENANTSNAGGYNGGGASAFYSSYTMKTGSGGGATDVRYFGNNYTPTTSELVWDSATGLNSRIMVAGGGGGANYTLSDKYFYYNGGDAGGLEGYTGGEVIYTNSSNGIVSGLGGTQLSGGANQNSSSYLTAKFGKGGTPKDGGANTGAGGGGGYYGGGGGAWAAGGGGGGSSYISGHTGSLAIASGSTTEPRALKSGCSASTTTLECSKHYSGLYFTNTKIIDGKGYEWTTAKSENITGMPSYNGQSTMNGNNGNGHARITYLGR